MPQLYYYSINWFLAYFTLIFSWNNKDKMMTFWSNGSYFCMLFFMFRKYSENGKISIVLVNSVPLVEQHAKVLRTRTHYRVGEYTGDMKLDFWSREEWHKEFDKYQILVMTCQILVNLYNSSYIGSYKFLFPCETNVANVFLIFTFR